MVSLASTERASGVIAPGVGGSLKRKTSDTDFDADSLTSSQIKKRRVTFDPEVELHILPDADEKSLELVGEEVRRALEKHAEGDNASYDELCHFIALKPTAADAPLTRLLHKYFAAFAKNVGFLSHQCRGLVHAIIDCTWITRKETFVQFYRHFLRSLLSVHPGYTSTVLAMLVNLFVNMPSPALHQQDDPLVDRTRMECRVHECLKYLLRQISMASASLAPILLSASPFPTDTVKAHAQYTANLLKVAEYCPELKGEILSSLMDRAVKIDVQIQVDMDELEDDIEDQLVEDAVDEETEADASDDESVSSEESLDEEEIRIKEVKENVAKLDAIMDLLFAYYSAIFASGNIEAVDQAFESLISQFANTILPTYRSRHAQFILFHFSQVLPDLTDHFAATCTELAFDQRRPQLLRTAAAAYLASFISRGAHVPRAVVRDVFDLLCHQLDTLRASYEPSCKGPDLRQYGTYYAISQALLYTFCFRWRDLMVTPDDSPITDEQLICRETDFTWYHSTKEILHRNIYCKLNPLKICAPTIVAQFARVAHQLHFVYVFPLIETNKRIRLTRTIGSYLDGIGAVETALSRKKGEELHLLDAYFPFDPYVLPRSKRWIEGDYVEWKPIPGMDSPVEKDDDEEVDDCEEEEAEDDDDESSSENGADDPEELEEVDGGTGTDLSI